MNTIHSPLYLTQKNTDLNSFILGLWRRLLVHPPPTPLYAGIDVERAKRKRERERHKENKTQPHLSAPVLLRNLMGDKS